MYVLTVTCEEDYMPPDVHGPFETIEEGQRYAEVYRRDVLDLDWVEATPENNEAWTDAGWYFGIVPVKNEVASLAS